MSSRDLAELHYTLWLQPGASEAWGAYAHTCVRPRPEHFHPPLQGCRHALSTRGNVDALRRAGGALETQRVATWPPPAPECMSMRIQPA